MVNEVQHISINCPHCTAKWGDDMKRTQMLKDHWLKLAIVDSELVQQLQLTFVCVHCEQEHTVTISPVVPYK